MHHADAKILNHNELTATTIHLSPEFARGFCAICAQFDVHYSLALDRAGGYLNRSTFALDPSTLEAVPL